MQREFRIEVVRNKNTDLLIGMSPDHKGFYVTARSEEELERKLPTAIRELMEAEGHRNVRVETVSDEGLSEAGFWPGEYTANVDYEAVA